MLTHIFLQSTMMRFEEGVRGGKRNPTDVDSYIFTVYNDVF